MAGASIAIDIEWESREVMAAFGRLLATTGNLEPVFRDIGEALLLAADERFSRQQAPDGTPWEPLSPKYQARKKKNQNRILVLDGYLHDLLRYQAGPDGVELGTDRIYGATHQFGRAEAGIPARPFLGLSEEDESNVLDILQEHFEGAVGK